VIEYLRDPGAIYARSFEIIRAEADFSHLPEDAAVIATRIVHACGMTEIAADLRISREFHTAARSAIHAGKPVLVDAEMVRHGIKAKALNIVCTLNDPKAREIGLRETTTRSAAAVGLWRPHIDGALVVIGNAPTALFALLELIDSGGPRPAAIAAFPVGFVGAAESKQELHASPRGIPYATLLGRKGGSAMAAAAVNALTEADC
jgi:precorrin-8X/cobalt-precorrin-8 methylmutase